MAEVGVAYVNIVPNADGFSASVAEASQEAGAAGGKGIGGSIMDALKSTVGNLFGTGGEMGESLSGGMESYLGGAGKLAIGAAVAAIGIEALRQLEEIGAEIDAMTDEIIVGTGASGEQLEEMRQIAMGMSQDVAVSFGDSGDIIQDFNTRLGLSGEELDNVATHAAQLNQVLGGINYDKMATMFNVWGVSADEMNAKMDYMFGVAQSTGIGFDQLTGIMQSSGPVLQNLGFSFEESANMAGLLDKAGIDASSTMSRMSKALVELSEPGESAQDAFRRTVEEMQSYIEAGDTAAALDIATEVFGTRGAAQFIGALQSGALNLDAISDAALGASGSIAETYEATEDWPERWQRIQSSVSAALEPLASGVFSTLGSIFEGIGAAMTALYEATEPVRAKFAEIADGISQRLAPVAQALSPVLNAIGNVVGGVLTTAFDVLATAIGAVADALSWLWDNILVPVADFLGGVFGPAVDAVGQAFEGAGEVIGGVCDALGAAWDGLSKTASDVFGGIAETVGTAMDEAGKAVSDAGSLISSALSGDWDAVQQKTDEIWQGVQQRIQGSLQNARNTVVPIADKIGSALGFPGLGEKVDRVFQGIQKFMEDPIENARKTIEEIPGKIVGFFSGLGERISRAIGSIHFPTPHITWDKKVDIGPASFTLPTVKWYATGGFVDRATLIGAGEAGPEMVLPQRGPMMDEFADAVADRLGGGVTVYLDYTANEDATEIANDIALALSRKLAMEA